jgi:uncharacterized protein YsxB (DUF464 family)
MLVTPPLCYSPVGSGFSQPFLILPSVILPVFAGFDLSPPGLVAAIPLYGFAEAVFKGVPGVPAEGGYFGAIEGIATVMTGPIMDEPDEFRWLSSEAQDGFGHLQVRLLAGGGDVVHLAVSAAAQNEVNGLTVVLDEEPVANVEAVAVEGKRVIIEGVGDEERNQFLRILIRAIVIGTARDDHREAKRGMIGKSEEVRRRLAGGIGAGGAKG